jgi:hypothetical protein
LAAARELLPAAAASMQRDLGKRDRVLRLLFNSAVP